jgi:hypothetical protein
MKTKLQPSKVKSIHAVDLKNRIQAELYDETKNLNIQDLISYYRKKAQNCPFKKKNKKVGECPKFCVSGF